MLFLAKLDATERILRTLCAWLCKMIYPLISWAYTLFMEIASFELLTSEEVRPIYERVTMVLAIVMVFYITFEFVKYVIQPDEMTSKEKGVSNLAYKLIAVVLLIAFVPQIFNLAYTVQSKVIESELLSKVILGKSGVDSTTFGREFSANMLNVFYYHDTEEWGEGEECGGIPCSEIVAANLETLRTEGKLPYLNTGLNEAGTAEMTKSDETTENVEVALIHFDALFAVVVGGFIAYMLILYCVDVGVRAVQMLYLQIIAPIPIIGFISPKKDGIFQKWCKQCLTTYLDLFIRMSVIYFILLVCQTLLDSNVFENLGEARFFVKVALIMGLLLFARKAPKMLQELFPSSNPASGNFGLKAGERVAPEVARVLGASSAGARRLVKGGIARAIDTQSRNKKNGQKSILTEEGRQQYKKRQENRKNLNSARREYKNALKTHRRNRKNAGYDDSKLTPEQKKAYEDARRNFETAQNQRKEDQNKRYRSVIGQGLAGAAGGAYRGVTVGGQATKLEDVGKKVKEAEKKDKDALTAREKWLDAGGGSIVERTKTQIAQNIGFQTDAQKTEQEVKEIEARVKEAERINEGESAIIKRKDEMKDNDIKKMSEGKLATKAVEDTVLEFTDGSQYVLKKGERVDTAFGSVKVDEENAQKELDAAISQNNNTPTEENQRKVNEASARLQAAKLRSAQIGKKLHEEVVLPQMIKAVNEYKRNPNDETKNPRNNGDFDQGSLSKLFETYWAIENARQNPATVESMKRILGSESDAFKAFMGIIDITEKTIDAIDKAIKRSTNERNEGIFSGKQRVSEIQASSTYDAQKADSGYSGSGQ